MPGGDLGWPIASNLAVSFSTLFDTLFAGMAKIDIRFDLGFDRFEDGDEMMGASDVVRSTKSFVTL